MGNTEKGRIWLSDVLPYHQQIADEMCVIKTMHTEGLWEALATRNAINYVQNHGDSLYRRSLYTIWKRSAPPPAMLNFDATDRSYCAVRRQKTASPLQALVLMNDPQFVEAARILAEKVQSTPSVSERLEYCFQALTSRKPRPAELDVLKDLLANYILLGVN